MNLTGRGAGSRTSRWTIRNDELSGKDSDEVVQALAYGRVIILPTDTIYGLHAIAASAAAVEKLFLIKARDDRKPFVVLCDTVARLAELGVSLSHSQREFLSSVWPAPLTVILPLAVPIAASAGSRSLAIRIPALEGLRGLLARTGPLASTSVNRSGEAPCIDLKDLGPDFHTRIAGVVDAGRREGRPSTVLDLTGPTPRVVRQGEFAFTQNLWKRLRKRL